MCSANKTQQNGSPSGKTNLTLLGCTEILFWKIRKSSSGLRSPDLGAELMGCTHHTSLWWQCYHHKGLFQLGRSRFGNAIFPEKLSQLITRIYLKSQIFNHSLIPRWQSCQNSPGSNCERQHESSFLLLGCQDLNPTKNLCIRHDCIQKSSSTVINTRSLGGKLYNSGSKDFVTLHKII